MVEKVLEVSRERMLEDIAEALKPFKPPPHWFTCDEMADLWGMSYHEVYRWLDNLIQEGIVKKHRLSQRQVYYEMVKGQEHD